MAQIGSLSINKAGFYSPSLKPNSAWSVSSNLTRDEKEKLHAALPGFEIPMVKEDLKPDLEAIYKDLGIRRGNLIVDCSKYLHKLISAEGVIDQIDSVAVLNSRSHEEFGSDGWKKEFETGPTGIKFHHFVKDQMFDERLVKDGSLQSTKDFFEKFLNGDLPEKLVTKPDMYANADGQIRFHKENGSVVIKIYDASGEDLSQGFLDRAFTIKSHCKDIAELELIDDNKFVTSYRLDTTNKEKAIESLQQVLLSSVNPSYREETNAMGMPVEKTPEGLCLGLESVIVEEEKGLLRLNGKIIEGRFFLAGGMDGKVGLTFGDRYNPNTRSRMQGPSFLKYGALGSDVVNMGDKDKNWPEMTEDIIEASGLDIDKEDFDKYLFTLLTSQAVHISKRASDLGLRLRVPLQIDIAWDASETMKVAKADGEGFIEVPRPILMEWNTPF